MKSKKAVLRRLVSVLGCSHVGQASRRSFGPLGKANDRIPCLSGLVPDESAATDATVSLPVN